MRLRGWCAAFERGVSSRPSTDTRTRLWSRPPQADSQPGAVGEPLVSIRHDGRTSAETLIMVRAVDCACAAATEQKLAAHSAEKIRADLFERYFTNTLRF